MNDHKVKGGKARDIGQTGKRELEAGRIVEEAQHTCSSNGNSLQPVRGIHCSPFGVIPKKGKAGRWWLIVRWMDHLAYKKARHLWLQSPY